MLDPIYKVLYVHYNRVLLLITLCGSNNAKLVFLNIIFLPDIYSMFSLLISLILNTLFLIRKGNYKVSMDIFIYNLQKSP